MSGIRYGLKKTPVRASTAENVVRADGSAESLMGVPCEYGTYDCRLTAARFNPLSLSGSTSKQRWLEVEHSRPRFASLISAPNRDLLSNPCPFARPLIRCSSPNPKSLLLTFSTLTLHLLNAYCTSLRTCLTRCSLFAVALLQTYCTLSLLLLFTPLTHAAHKLRVCCACPSPLLHLPFMPRCIRPSYLLSASFTFAVTDLHTYFAPHCFLLCSTFT